MMQLVGRFVLGCILAVHVLADVATEQPHTSSPELLAVTTPEALVVIDVVTENLNKSSPTTPSPPEITKRITIPETPSTPDKNTKIFGAPIKEKEKVEREIVVIHNQSPGNGHHSDHGYHDHHGHHDHHYDQDYHHHPPPTRPPPHHHDHDHDYHHHPPPTRPRPNHHDHDHHHPAPHHQHYPHQPYPSYYPPHHYPPPMPYSHGMPQTYAATGVVPYPYYPPPIYYHQSAMRPSSTVVQGTTNTNSQSISKPTDLLNQGTEYLWSLFGRLGAVTHDNHEVVVIHPKPVMPSPTIVAVQTLPTDMNPDKTKKVLTKDCNHKDQ